MLVSATECRLVSRSVVRLADFSRTSSPRVHFSTSATGECTPADQVTSAAEVSGYLVGSPAFKAGGRGDPTTAGSIPVHLRHHSCRRNTNSRVRRHILSPGARRREHLELSARPATFRVVIHPNWMNDDTLVGRAGPGGV